MIPTLFLRASELKGGALHNAVTPGAPGAESTAAPSAHGASEVGTAGNEAHAGPGTPDLLVPRLRPGLEFVLQGYYDKPTGCPQAHPYSTVSCAVAHFNREPVRAFEMIAGEPGRWIPFPALSRDTWVFDTGEFKLEGTVTVGDPFSFVKALMAGEGYWGIEWRLGDEPIAQVKRSDFGLE